MDSSQQLELSCSKGIFFFFFFPNFFCSAYISGYTYRRPLSTPFLRGRRGGSEEKRKEGKEI